MNVLQDRPELDAVAGHEAHGALDGGEVAEGGELIEQIEDRHGRLGGIVILAVLAAILAVTRQFQSLSSISGRSYTFLILSGMATGGSWICYFRALKLGDAARVAPIDKLSVVLVAIFGVIFLGEHLSLPNWAGVALIAAGAVLVAYKG